MAIVTPSTFSKLDDNQLDFGSSLAEATMKQLGRNINYLVDSAPVGTIAAVATNLNGMTSPNSSIWQICDGSEITHPDSPLRSQGAQINFTPDLTDGRFLRGNTTASQGGTGGQTSYSFSGSTGAAPSNNSGDLAEIFVSPINFDYAPGGHNHSFSVNFSNVQPPYYDVVWYLKIN